VVDGLPASEVGAAAGGIDALAGDPASALRRQEGDDAGDVGRLTYPVERRERTPERELFRVVAQPRRVAVDVDDPGRIAFTVMSRSSSGWASVRVKALDVAMREFWRRGYDAVSIAQLTGAIRCRDCAVAAIDPICQAWLDHRRSRDIACSTKAGEASTSVGDEAATTTSTRKRSSFVLSSGHN
jgi:hypothetical protein